MFIIQNSDDQIRNMLNSVVEDPTLRAKLFKEVKVIRDQTVRDSLRSLKTSQESYIDKILNQIPSENVYTNAE